MNAAGAKIGAWSLMGDRGVRKLGIPPGEATRLDGSVLASTLLLNCLGLLLPIATLHVFDRVIPNGAYETLLLISLGLMVVAVAELALRWTQARLNALATARYGGDLRKCALDRLLQRPMSNEPAAANSLQIERLTAIDRFASFYSGGARECLIELPFSFLALGLIALLGGWVVLAPILTIALHFLVLSRLNKAIRERLRVRRTDDVKSRDFLTEAFRSAVTFKSLGLESLLLRRYERLLASATTNHREMLALNAAVQQQNRLTANFATITTLALGATLAIAADVTVGAVAASTLLAGRAMQPALRAAQGWSDVQRAVLSAEEIRPLYETAPENSADAAAQTPSDPPSAPKLQFSAQGGGFPAGAIIAVDGGDAYSRRHLLEAVAGLREPPTDAGKAELRVAGVSPIAFRTTAPGVVAFIGRAPQPLSGSIIDNLTVFQRGASDSAAYAAAERVGLNDEVQRMPKGYLTSLAASGADALSVPGHVKLAIARAIALDAKLLILEEPTAYLSTGDARLLTQELADRAASRASTILLATRDAQIRKIVTHVLRIRGGAERAPTGLRAT